MTQAAKKNDDVKPHKEYTYRVSKTRPDAYIERCEVIRRTDKSITYISGSFPNHKRMERLESDTHRHYDSAEEAIAVSVAACEKAIATAEQHILRYRERLTQLAKRQAEPTA